MAQGWGGGTPTPEQPPYQGLPLGWRGAAPGQATGWEHIAGPGGGYGAPRGGAPNPWNTPPRPPKDNGAKIVAITAAVTLAVAGAGVGLYLGLSGSSGSTNTAAARPAASASTSTSHQPTTHQPTDSPRDVVTAFLNAAKADDFNTAEQLVCPSLRSQMDPRADSGGGLRSFTVETPVRSGDEWMVPVEIVTADEGGDIVPLTVVVVHQNAKYLVCGVDTPDEPSAPDSGGPSDNPYSGGPSDNPTPSVGGVV